MKLNDLIMKLQNLEAEHGNLDVLHSDCEWGVDEAKAELRKVIDVGYKLEVSAEEAESMRAEVTKGFDPVATMAEVMTWYEVADKAIFNSPQVIVDNMRGNFDEKVKMLAHYDAAQFSVVIGQ